MSTRWLGHCFGVVAVWMMTGCASPASTVEGEGASADAVVQAAGAITFERTGRTNRTFRLGWENRKLVMSVDGYAPEGFRFVCEVGATVTHGRATARAVQVLCTAELGSIEETEESLTVRFDLPPGERPRAMVEYFGPGDQFGDAFQFITGKVANGDGDDNASFQVSPRSSAQNIEDDPVRLGERMLAAISALRGNAVTTLVDEDTGRRTQATIPISSVAAWTANGRQAWVTVGDAQSEPKRVSLLAPRGRALASEAELTQRMKTRFKVQ